MSIRRRLENFIETAKAEGVMDNQYEQTRSLQDTDDPHFMPNLIAGFLRDADSNIITLSELLDEDDVDFNKVTKFVLQLKGASSSLGGCRLAALCLNLKDTCDNEDTEGYIELYDRVVTEYHIFRSKLRTLYQMEREISNNAAV